MSQVWQIQVAKNKFNEVVAAALAHGPQIITKSGTETAIVLSYVDYRELLLSRQKLSEFFRNSPLVGVELDIARNSGMARREPEL